MRDEYDFSEAKPVPETPVLAEHQARNKGKTRITMYIDSDVLDAFRAEADAAGQGYQTMVNAALREYLERKQGVDLESILRRVIREELRAQTFRAQT
jgi:uncharacterized protein (DUF4415 family)